MESPISLSAASDPSPSPAASDPSELASNVHDAVFSRLDEFPSHSLGAEWSDGQTTSWGPPFTSNWGTDHLTRSTVLQTVRSDFHLANLTAAGTDDRNTALDDLDNRAWSSIQLYRSSEQGRRDHAPFPSFTLPQVERRYQEVQASIRSRLQQKEELASEIEVLVQNLADKKRKAKEIEDDLVFLSKASTEISETGHISDRPKFEISLAEYLRKGLTARDYAKYKPEITVSGADSESSKLDPPADLTPQQKARKRYEERNKEARRAKAKERMAKIQVLDDGLPILKTSDISKKYTRNDTARSIAKNVDMVKIVVDHSVISRNGARDLSPTIANVGMGAYNVLRTTQHKISVYITMSRCREQREPS
ncbi:hypothetical protein EV361DRAFT_871089 [Lentinula raphanica]|nr:hypothetical protein EV361DRAFT_871089 [Lentinula raphanica]